MLRKPDILIISFIKSRLDIWLRRAKGSITLSTKKKPSLRIRRTEGFLLSGPSWIFLFVSP